MATHDFDEALVCDARLRPLVFEAHLVVPKVTLLQGGPRAADWRWTRMILMKPGLDGFITSKSKSACKVLSEHLNTHQIND